MFDHEAYSIGCAVAESVVSRLAGNTVHRPPMSRRDGANELRGLEPAGYRSRARHRWRRRMAAEFIRGYVDRFCQEGRK